MLTPVCLYLRIRDLYPQSALLESSDYQSAQNSTSIIGVCPIGTFKVSGGKVSMTFPGSTEIIETVVKDVIDASGSADVISLFNDYISAYGSDDEINGDVSGLLGYTAYDAVRYFEKVPVTRKEKCFESIPDMYYIFYRYIIQINHYNSTLTIYEHLIDGQQSGIDDLSAIISNNNIALYPFETIGDATSTITDDEYVEMVQEGIRHAKRGDVFQIVLSRRFSQKFKGDDFNVYRSLRSINPSPYLFYFDFGEFRVFGSSPETHLRIKGETAYIDPIAGTFKRSGDEERDREIAKALLADEKENAEHIMLVDLARNDLSRSGGKVEIEFLKQIQYYSHVIHMVSRVKATLPPGTDNLRIFASTFPAGTLSGAPKVRAMQLIDELEPHSRLIYGGCIGFVGLTGNLNQAITIRSFLSYNNTLYSQAGAGIVARSNPHSELAETNNKLGALVRAVNQHPQI